MTNPSARLQEGNVPSLQTGRGVFLMGKPHFKEAMEDRRVKEGEGLYTGACT
ncbi:hypothetical protein GCM10010917_37920 [Paenibacillus physcomitrellae]|uniref:Uncharacterized protein n=1 Tax=Paenibacillus physcomitrellae TaxID=1619311 RepID=A0ABQ1GRU0_9BACL|nr:hypothetical protein GCM10010917_37920 [Paenibacillus physcomitrellae]